ncbi:hypothetical protein OUZ56_016319 [Daphnia magna]|uniref:Uncharacterized protein n=1 Tax=Daphnia magna TaxID=35525 RepID=A0ABR0AQA1_9CRUS|nr:hypothetical protein OUZ56_016319 [Daphnia magna]
MLRLRLVLRRTCLKWRTEMQNEGDGIANPIQLGSSLLAITPEKMFHFMFIRKSNSRRTQRNGSHSLKCEFEKDCCAACQNTRLLGQVVFGVFDDEVRRKLLEQGATLILDQALATLRTAEVTQLQACNIKQGGGEPILQIKSKSGKQQSGRSESQHRDPRRNRPNGPQHAMQRKNAQLSGRSAIRATRRGIFSRFVSREMDHR